MHLEEPLYCFLENGCVKRWVRKISYCGICHYPLYKKWVKVSLKQILLFLLLNEKDGNHSKGSYEEPLILANQHSSLFIGTMCCKSEFLSRHRHYPLLESGAILIF